MRNKLNRFLVGVRRNAFNRVRFGAGAPRFNQKIWIAPSREIVYFGKRPADRKSVLYGKVITGVWPFDKLQPMAERLKMQVCHRRWVRGMSWEEAGAYKWMEETLKKKQEIDGCRCRQDIIDRYKKLDDIYYKVKKNNGFDSDFYITVHVGPDGALFFGFGGGAHRLAMAHILDLPIQARVGLVHFQGIPSLQNYSSRTRFFINSSEAGI